MKRPPPGRGSIVYSTELGRMCTSFGRPLAYCTCKQASVPVGDGNVRVGRETKGRKGKGVTIITGVPLAHAEMQALATHLKKRCGSGGTLKDGVIEIQGDHRDLVVDELQKRGWNVKRSGG